MRSRRSKSDGAWLRESSFDASASAVWVSVTECCAGGNRSSLALAAVVRVPAMSNICSDRSDFIISPMRHWFCMLRLILKSDSFHVRNIALTTQKCLRSLCKRNPSSVLCSPNRPSTSGAVRLKDRLLALRGSARIWPNSP